MSLSHVASVCNNDQVLRGKSQCSDSGAPVPFGRSIPPTSVRIGLQGQSPCRGNVGVSPPQQSSPFSWQEKGARAMRSTNSRIRQWKVATHALKAGGCPECRVGRFSSRAGRGQLHSSLNCCEHRSKNGAVRSGVQGDAACGLDRCSLPCVRSSVQFHGRNRIVLTDLLGATH